MKITKITARTTAQTVTGDDSAEIIEALYNDAEGPAARMLAFREGVRCTLEALGVNFSIIPNVNKIKFARPVA